MPEAPAAPAPSSIVAPPADSASFSDAAASAAALGSGSRGSSLFNSKTMDAAFESLDKKGKQPDAQAGKGTANIPRKEAQKEAQKETPKQEAKKVEAPKQQEAPKKVEAEQAGEVAANEQQEAPKEGQKEALKPGEVAKPKKPADFLREQLTKVSQERDTFKAEIAKLKGAPKDSPELKSLSEERDKLRGDLDKLHEELKYSNYERSEEYKSKWEEPFIDAYQSGRAKIKALKVNNLETGEARQGAEADFDAVMSAPTEEAAAEMIESMFGTGARAHMVTLAREKVLDINSQRTKAIEDFRQNGSAREKQATEFYSKLSKEVAYVWEQSIKAEAVPEKHKSFILPKGNDEAGQPLDAEGDSALEAGYKSFDRSAGEDARDPNLTPEQRSAVVGRAAAIRHRAAAYPRLIKWLEQRDARIADLEQSLAAYQTSEPGAGDGDRGEEKVAAGGSTMDSIMSQMERKGTPIFH